FLTIQKAADTVNPGDTVIVEDGTYTNAAGGPLVAAGRGGASTNWVWFKARHRWGAKLDGMNNTNDLGWSFQNNVGYVRVEGFELFGMGANGSGDAFDCYNGGHDVQIIGN